MEILKPVLWKGGNLVGSWEVTYKIDGVRCIISNGQSKSKGGKPLHNIPSALKDGDYEIFVKSWNETISLVRTYSGVDIDPLYFYSLLPLDERLYIGELYNPSEEVIYSLLKSVVEDGWEGLVLRQNDKWLKVKPEETYDVEVLDFQYGTGKNEGRLGSVITEMGRVGVGFSDEERDFPLLWVGKTIEVSCMSLTENGKFRHPRFVRERSDK
jgi:ATP-dependent DNA ligase